MPARRSSSRHRAVPVKVVVEKKPLPARRAPVHPQPVSAPRASTKISSVPEKTEWSEAHRRRLMWVIVSIGSGIAILAWLFTFQTQIRHATPTFFGDVTRLIRDIRFPGSSKPQTKEEKEIRQLEKQVFPQFQK